MDDDRDLDQVPCSDCGAQVSPGRDRTFEFGPQGLPETGPRTVKPVLPTYSKQTMDCLVIRGLVAASDIVPLAR